MLENAIVMPRDITANHPGYVKVKELLTVNPYKEKKKEKKKKKKGEQDRGPQNLMLEPNDEGNYRVYEMGNYPLVAQSNKQAQEGAEKELRPKNFAWRLKLPADAEWSPRDPAADAERAHKLAENRKRRLREAGEN